MSASSKAVTLRMTLPLTPRYVLTYAHSGYWYSDKESRTGRNKRGRWPALTNARMAAGVQLLVCPSSQRIAPRDPAMVGRILTGWADGQDLDVLLQLSLFGGVVYG